MHKAYVDYTKSLTMDVQPEIFELYCNRRSAESSLFKHWFITLNFELTLLTFTRSLREANFNLYIEAIDKLIQWFLVLDHPNYARWLRVHRRDKLNLAAKHHLIAEHFHGGICCTQDPPFVLLYTYWPHIRAEQQIDKG